MNADRQEAQKSQSDKRRRRRLRRGAIALVIAGVVLCVLWAGGLLLREDVDARLAAIDAERAIPDEQNAAIIYDSLMQDFGSLSVPQGIVNDATDTTTKDPWATKDNPQLAAWIKQQQGMIDGFLQLAGITECRFPVGGYPENFRRRMDRLAAVRRWMFILIRAANNDVADGRIDSAVEKYVALIRLADHLYQQPVITDNLVGYAIEAFASGRMRGLIVTGPCTEAHLRTIESAILPYEDKWDIRSRRMIEVDRLYSKKERKDLLTWLQHFWSDHNTLYFEKAHEQYVRLLSYRRGMRILIALRRHREETGQWAQSLDQIRGSLPAAALVDPLNGGVFVYRLTEDSFTLYSKGRNGLDEDGERKPASQGGPDDQPLWPR